MAAHWSAGDQHRIENTNNADKHQYTCNQSTPNMSPIMPNYSDLRYYDNHGWQDNNFDRRQVPEQRRFSCSSYNKTNVNNTNILHVLDSYSSKQALSQMTLNSIQEYDGNNKDATILWLDHIEMIVEKTGLDPLEVGISKLKRLAIGNINTICKEGNLTLYSFRHRLIEHYSGMPYASDAMFTYSHLLQHYEEPITQYLARA